MDVKGDVTQSQNIKNEEDALEAFVDSLKADDAVILEATGAWYHFYCWWKTRS